MASRQKRTREQVRLHELAHLQKLQEAGIGKMKTDEDVQAALGRYMRSHDFKDAIGVHCVQAAYEAELGGGFHGILFSYAVASFRLVDKKHGNAEATRDAIKKELIPRFLKKYDKVDQDPFTKGMMILLDQIIEVGKAVLAGTQNAQGARSGGSAPSVAARAQR